MAPCQPTRFQAVSPATISNVERPAGFAATAFHATNAIGRPVPLDSTGRWDKSSEEPVRLLRRRCRSQGHRSDDFAVRQQTGNWSLLHLIDRIQNPDAFAPARQQPPQPRQPKPDLSPDERDYRSVVDVLEKNNRSVSMAVLGKVRRRWLERQPRDPSSRHPNRLADVLARMVADGVLLKQGTRYVPGPNYARFVGTPEPAGVA